jgi:O-antigen ligase
VIVSLGLLFFFTEAVRFVVLNPDGQGSTVLADDPVRAPTQRFIFALAGGLLVFKWRATLASVRDAWPFWLISVLAASSAAWSIDRGLSLRSGAWLTATSLLGMHFDLRYSVRTQLRLLGAVFAAVILLSFIFVSWYPTYGLEIGIHAGAWRGAFIHKNSLGRAMALSALVFAFLLPGARRSATFAVAALVASVVLGWQSQSATAPVLLVLFLALIPLRAVIKRRELRLSRVITLLLAVVGIGAWIVVASFESILGALGRDTSLSGRPLLWAVLIPEILNKPLLGYGLGAFWKGSTGAAAGVESIVRWNPGQAHNGFIDVAIDVGLVGLGIFLLAMTIIAWRAAWYARRHREATDALWPLAFLLFLTMSNMTESSLLRPNTIFWFLFAAVSTRVMRSRHAVER